MFQKLKKWINDRSFRKRVRKIRFQCNCVCYCPNCGDPLNDQAKWTPRDEWGKGEYECHTCGNLSLWHFGIAPVPICYKQKQPKPKYGVTTTANNTSNPTTNRNNN